MVQMCIIFVNQTLCFDVSSCNNFADTSGFLDSLLSSLGEKFGSDDHWDLWESYSFTKYLVVSLYIIILINNKV